MVVLVTGACGFVGLNVVEHLLRAGRPVIGLDRIGLPSRAAALFATLPGRLRLLQADVLSPGELANAFAGDPVDAVIHAAVVTAGPERERRDPEGIVAVNVSGAVNVLAAAGRAGLRRFVYPSSGAVYGAAAANRDPVGEDTPAAPVMTYGMTKQCCEILLPRLASVFGLSFAAARLASVFGPWEYDTGARDTLSPMLGALRCALAGEEAVLNHAGRGDFCYAPDIAAGLVALVDAPTLGQSFYNLGSGVGATAADWCRALAEARPGFRWRVAEAGEAANVVSHVAFDRGGFTIAAARRDAGWSPRFDLPAAARHYLEWAA